MVADRELAHAGADVGDDARAFVTEHDGARRGQVARQDGQVGMADADGGDLDLDLAGEGCGLVDLFDRNVADASTDGCAHESWSLVLLCCLHLVEVRHDRVSGERERVAVRK